MSIKQILKKGVTLEQVANAFDALPYEKQVAEMRQLKKEDLIFLYNLAEGNPCTVDDDLAPKAHQGEIVYEGKSSLGGASKFKKRIFRPSANGNEVMAIGRNELALNFIIGPGYFTAMDSIVEGCAKTVIVDYEKLPEQTMEGWPTIRPNNTLLSKPAFGNMKDILWKVGSGVIVGRAHKNGKWADNFFLLCRKPAS